MPNWCDNSVTLYHEDKSKIDALAEEMEKKNATNQSMACPFQHLRPRPESEEENWYDWNINFWGTKWEASVIDWNRDDDNTITIYFESAWSPPIALYDHLTGEGWGVNALYHECGMAFAGMYSDGCDDYYEYDPADKDSIDALPSDVIDFAGLENAYHDHIVSQLEEEWGDAERTDWFDAKTKPMKEGWYEVSTKSWEFPHFMQFVDGEWDCYDSKTITKWRGLANDPNEWDHAKALEEIEVPK